MGRFKSLRRAQRFLTAHEQINTIFPPRRYRLSAKSYPHAESDAFELWADYALEMKPLKCQPWTLKIAIKQLGNTRKA